MTLAFVVQTYKDLDQIEHLARTLARGTRDRLTVINHRGSDSDRKRLAGTEGVDHVLPSPGGRARFGVIDGLISSMRWLEKQPKLYDWLFVLSGQDYPVRPLRELEAELQSSDLDGYFHHFDALNEIEAMAPPMRWDRSLVEERYHFQYTLLKENVSRLDRALLKIPRHLIAWSSRSFRLHTSFALMLGHRPAEMPFTPDFKLYGGNYWMTISRKAVRALLEFVDQRPDIVHYFRGVIAPEESFVQTVLANNPDLKLTRRELRYADFANTNHGSLKELGLADLVRVRASGCYLARKLDFRRNPGLSEALDKIVLGPGALRVVASASELEPKAHAQAAALPRAS